MKLKPKLDSRISCINFKCRIQCHFTIRAERLSRVVDECKRLASPDWIPRHTKMSSYSRLIPRSCGLAMSGWADAGWPLAAGYDAVGEAAATEGEEEVEEEV